MRTIKSNQFSFLFPKFSPQAHGAKLQKLTEMELRNWYACNYSIHISIGMPFPNSIAFICTCDFHKQSSQECIKNLKLQRLSLLTLSHPHAAKLFILESAPTSSIQKLLNFRSLSQIYDEIMMGFCFNNSLN